MQSRYQDEPRTAAPDGEDVRADDNELSILRDVLRMLPAGVTLQDEHGRFLLVNDAAAVQFGMADAEPAAPASRELSQRRETGLELLRAGRAAVAEECVTRGEAKQVFLAAHRPAPCPLCGAEMQPTYGAHALPIGGRCGECGTTLQ